MSVEELYGLWHLVSIYSVNDRGDVNHHFGKDAVGRLAYHPEGYMNVIIMRPGRRKLSGDGIGEGTLEEIAEAYDGFEAYSGRYKVDHDAGTVIHHVDIARSPSWEGTDQLRHFSIRNGVLKIHTPPMEFGGGTWSVHVAWEKRG